MPNTPGARTKRYFFGRNDPNKILLESVFPLSDISFATPIHEEGPHPRVVVEGNREHLDILEEYLEELVANAPSERFFGKWALVSPDEITGGLSLYYNPLAIALSKFELLVFVLRRHLVRVCDLRLAPIGLVTATWSNFEIDLGSRLAPGSLIREVRPVPLPEDVGNGHIELPVIILPDTNNFLQ